MEYRYRDDDDIIEIGVDEAGRGPLFGPVYACAVALPAVATFDYSGIKDSKRFSSARSLGRAAKVVKDGALAHAVASCDSACIDKINIRQATLRAMKLAIGLVIAQLGPDRKVRLLIDGCDFTGMIYLQDGAAVMIPHHCITKGDSKLTPIAAASILAKQARDAWIADAVAADPTLDARYGLASNKGYGTAVHMAGIKTHGVAEGHRRSFKPCKGGPTPTPSSPKGDATLRRPRSPARPEV